jgi:hypothetical protein
MEQNIRDFGKITKLMDEDNFGILIKIHIRDSGKMIKRTVTACSIIQTA